MDDWRRLNREALARHSNPWSAWTRWASAPLMLVPAWGAADGLLGADGSQLRPQLPYALKALDKTLSPAEVSTWQS